MTLMTVDSRADRLDILPGGVGRSTFAVGNAAPYAVRAEGHLIWDADGNELIDVNNNMTVNLHGNAHPSIVAAIEGQLARGFLSLGIANDEELQLARALLARMPWARNVRFANSGTEAVMLAVRVARAATGRNLAVALEPGYHGTSDVVLPSLGVRGVVGVPDAVQQQTVLVPRNDTEALRRVLDEHGGRVAAVILDLCANRAGLDPLTSEFVDVARSFTEASDAYLVVDEVVTFRNGFSGLTAEYDLAPDIVALGKVIGGGLPIGAIVGRGDALEPLNPKTPLALEHGGTFTGNPLTMAAGTVTLDLFDAPAVDRLNALSADLGRAMVDGLVGSGWEFRRSGSVFRLWPSGWAASDRAAAQKELYWSQYRHGVLGTGTGLSTLSTVMDDGIVEELAERLLRATAEVRPG